MDPARRSTRYPSGAPLQVRCDTWHEFVQLYASDISQGGMFIITDDSPPIMSMIDIRISLPEATEIVLSGRVVHVIDKALAQTDGRQAGAGIEFVDLDAERKRQIYQLIEFARWQGHDPSASFAKTMFELEAARASKVPPQPQAAGNTGAGAQAPAQGGHASRPPHMQSSAVVERGTRNSLPGDPVRASQDGVRASYDASRAVTRNTADGERAATRKTADGERGATRRVTLDGTQKSAHPADQGFSLRPDGTQRKRSDPSMPRVSTPPASRDSGSHRLGATPSAAPANRNSGTPTAIASDKPVANAKPIETSQLTDVITHFAHKRFDAALKRLDELLIAYPGDAQVIKWQHMCHARKAITKQDEKSAVLHYEKALTLDEGNREAREFVRTHHRDKRLEALPFGRYFVKKK